VTKRKRKKRHRADVVLKDEEAKKKNVGKKVVVRRGKEGPTKSLDRVEGSVRIAG